MVLALLFVACDGGTDDTDNSPIDSAAAPAPTTQEVEDVFVQSTLDPVDFLWVLDPNWENGFVSLEDAKDAGYEALLLADTNWKMGFATADTNNPSQRGVIRGEHRTVFPDEDVWVLPPTEERTKVFDGIASVFTDRFDENEEFFRDDAHLHIMVLTNKRDDASAISLDAIEDLFDRQADYTQSIRVSALIGGSAGVQEYWREVTDRFGGTTFVTGSWEKGVQAVYQHGIGQQREFALQDVPISPPRELVTTYREQNTVHILGDTYEYDALQNSVIFTEQVPLVGTTIRVPYEVATGGTE